MPSDLSLQQTQVAFSHTWFRYTPIPNSAVSLSHVTKESVKITVSMCCAIETCFAIHVAHSTEYIRSDGVSPYNMD